ncbi:MAG: TRAP transporter large permease subunit [Gammaproteobacteria bacterium]|nr:TRAP transporter large permease subunit [Gammaproteobacteria bacterium]NNF61768.1 TRAP transporter large permease subunit [Gammaproteobacteria bacterium]NNM20433.1 TRAP transporter large permease subunit [Gammaproteobacteria bacterium]
MLMMAALVLLALFGAPLFAVIGASALFAFHGAEIDLSVVAIEIFGLAEMPVLLAIPLFTFAGYVLSESEAPHRLVRVTNALIGWMPGGLAIVALAACALFTAFTGASGVTIIALGALLYPALSEAGYRDKFNLGLITSSGSLGLLFAPSLPLILYGIVAKTSIDDLFLAGLLPGLLMLVLLSAWAILSNPQTRVPVSQFSTAEAAAALREAALELPLPVVVLGGIYSGYFAVSEAAAVTAAYVFLVEVVIRREITWRRLPGLMRESMVLVGGILMILGVSLASTNFVIDSGLPEKLFELLDGFVSSKGTFIALLIVFLLILGAFLDIFSALVLVVPMILPVAMRYQVDPVHLGIIFLATMQLGYMTPPVGLNLFIASYRFDKPIMQVYAASIPFLVILLAAVLVIAYWPGLSLFFLQ